MAYTFHTHENHSYLNHRHHQMTWQQLRLVLHFPSTYTYCLTRITLLSSHHSSTAGIVDQLLFLLRIENQRDQ